MARRKQTAAEYIDHHDAEMRIIIGELVESAAVINLSWTNARLRAREHPEDALRDLVEAETRLHHHVRLELSDSLRRVRSAIDRLEAELPPEDVTPRA